ncbi:MAG: GNAT family N-acetyltransferase [Pseudomonadota bacterium]
MANVHTQLRAATLHDLEAVQDVYLAAYPSLMSGYYAPDTLRAALPLMTKPWPTLLSSGRFFVVEGDGRLEAVGGWSDYPPGREHGPAHIRHFATRPSAARKGFGGVILEKCLEQARLTGLSVIDCFASLNAESFYADHGFTHLGYRQVKVAGVPFAVVEMRAPL